MHKPHEIPNTKAGGARPPTDEEAKKIPPLPQHVIDDLKARYAARTGVKGSNLNRFNAQYPTDLFQGGTGICTGGTGGNAAMMAAVTQGVAMPMASAFFAYYTATGDATFTHGYSISGVVSSMGGPKGWCSNAFYSQDQALAWFNAWTGHTFSAAELPQPPAYTDGATRKILQWNSVPKDRATVVALLRAGHPIGFGIGNHAVCAIDLSDDDYLLLCKDTEIVGDQGYGRGIRAFNMDLFLANAWDLVTVRLIQPGAIDPIVIVTPPPPPPPPPPTGNTQMLLDTIKADANALVLGKVTQAQIDKLKADAALLVADPVVVVVTPPPPPTGAVFMPPALQLVDGAGYTWTRGEFVDARYGHQLLCNGRSLKTTLNNALVNGKLRCNEMGTWYEFSGNPYAPVWTPTTAP